MLSQINISLNGRSFPLPRCQQLFDSKPNMEARGQKAIGLIQRAYASGNLSAAQERLVNAAQEMQSYIQSMMPEVMSLAALGYTEDEVQALVTKLDNASLPLIQELIDAVDAVLAEAGE